MEGQKVPSNMEGFLFLGGLIAFGLVMFQGARFWVDMNLQSTYRSYGVTGPDWVKSGSEFFHYDSFGKLHHEDSPAHVRIMNPYNFPKQCEKKWYFHGVLHRTDGPAVEHSSGTREYWIMGKRHNFNDEPASVVVENGRRVQKWYDHDLLHRENNPAVIVVDKSDRPILHEWYQMGVRHCIDGPAVIHYMDGRITRSEWWVDGKRHRTDGPAVWDQAHADEFWENGVRIK